jgi:putative transcriptional regulator
VSVRHHVSDELIVAYAAGELDEAVGLLVASHMALCPECRRGLAAAEALAGAMLEQLPEAEVGAAALEAVLDRIAREAPEPGPAAPPPAGPGFVLPRPLRDYAGGDVDTLRWRPLGGGVRHLPVDTGRSRARARLLLIPPEVAVPDHGHRGIELTLVLAGSFEDRGVWFRRGDVEASDASVEHRPVSGPGEPCICLLVTDAPLRFRGVLARLVQPFLGI